MPQSTKYSIIITMNLFAIHLTISQKINAGELKYIALTHKVCTVHTHSASHLSESILARETDVSCKTDHVSSHPCSTLNIPCLMAVSCPLHALPEFPV